MIYENLVSNFVRRTRQTLAVLRQAQANGQEVFEVTQLINSMLGLLAFPRQGFVQWIPETPIEDIRAEGWPIPRIVGNFPQVSNLRQLVRYLRNAITHFNVKFLADGGGEICGVEVWNENNQGQITWKAGLTLKELEGISNRFGWLLEETKRSNNTMDPTREMNPVVFNSRWRAAYWGRWADTEPSELNQCGYG